MAKVYIERAYIEPDGKKDPLAILLHIKEMDVKGNIDHIYVGKVELDKPIKWLYTENAENGDLIVNNSKSMEGRKWNYLIREITGEICLD